MSNNFPTKNVLISCVILTVICCLCLCLATAGASIVWSLSPLRLPTPPVAPSSPGARPTRTPSDEATPAALSELSPEIVAQMETIEQQVSRLRGLTAEQATERALLSPAQLRQHVMQDMLQDYTPEEAQEDTLALSAFGLLPADYELHSLYTELLSEQIAGFYDLEAKQMYVVQGEGFLGAQRMTYAHEFTHALQDQMYDIRNGLNYRDEYCEAHSEGCAAVQALIEGDATLAELTWLQEYATTEDKRQILQFYNSYESPVFDSAPDFLQKDFLFPYEQGLAFVQSLYDAGGWEAVDAAYRNLPQSTEHILHPENYPNDQPQTVELPDLLPALGAGWQLTDQGVMGEWYTVLILAHGWEEDARLDEDQARQAAAGWGGDAYQVFTRAGQASNGNEIAMLLATTWDTAQDANEFHAAFGEYATARFGAPLEAQPGFSTWQTDAGYTVLYLDGSQTTWIFAPDAETARKLWAEAQP